MKQHISTFQSAFMIILEDITAGSGGAFGDTGVSTGWNDPSDSRMPFAIGAGKLITRPGMSVKKSTKKRKKKKKKVLKSSYRTGLGVDTRLISPKLPIK